MTDCIFCQAVDGDLPIHKVFEDDLVLAFLDIHPIREGHTLIIPKDHHVWFEDIPEPIASRIFTVGQRLAQVMKSQWHVERVSFFFTGIHVAHAHAHVVPMHHNHDVTSAQYLTEGLDAFSLPPSPEPFLLAQIADRIRAGL